MSISRRGLVNPSTPIFPNINLAQTMADYLLLEKSYKNGWNNLYLDPITKSFSYLVSISRCGTVISSNPHFS